MRKNELSNKIAKERIKDLLRKGYTKAELSRGIGLAYKTIENILDPKKEFTRLETHKKIAQFQNNIGADEEPKTNEQTTDSYFLTSEDIIDSKAAEEEAKEISKWIKLITIYWVYTYDADGVICPRYDIELNDSKNNFPHNDIKVFPHYCVRPVEKVEEKEEIITVNNKKYKLIKE